MNHTTILLIVMGVFLIICGGLLFSSFIKRPACVAVLILGLVLILLAAYNYYEVTSRNSFETEAKSNYKAGASLYIDGKRQKAQIDMNGLNFDKYDIRIEKRQSLSDFKIRKELNYGICY